LEAACRDAGPGVELHGVIARGASAQTHGEARWCALVSRDGRTISGTRLYGLDVDALATTHTGSRDVLLIGRDAATLVELYRTVVGLGGGMACPGATLPLPVFGYLYDGGLAALADELARFERAAGISGHQPPSMFVTLFLTLPALPTVAL